jgi:hypothetical protein
VVAKPLSLPPNRFQNVRAIKTVTILRGTTHLFATLGEQMHK